MANVEKVSIALTPEMATLVRDAVETGEYASVSEIMREALRAWKQQREQRTEAIEAMRRLWNEGIASGDAEDIETVFTRIEARLDARALKRQPL